MKYENDDKIAHILLVGFIEKHKETCPEVDCSLRLQTIRNGKNIDQNFLEQMKNLAKEINRMYLNGLKKFPNSVKLRLSYAFFTLD